MKTMNYTTILTLLFLAISCSNESVRQEEDLTAVSAQAANGEQQEVFELDLNHLHTFGYLADLEEEKNSLLEQIDAGDESLIPVLESVQQQFDDSLVELGGIRELSCRIMEIVMQHLQAQADDGDEEAMQKLINLQERFESCGLDVEDYFYETITTYHFSLIREGSDGGCGSPGVDWNCDEKFREGILLINITESQPEPDNIQLVDQEGQVLSVAEAIGEHSLYEGVTQFSLEVIATEGASIEITKGGKTYQRSVVIE